MKQGRGLELTILAMAIAPMSEMISISAIVNIYTEFPDTTPFLKAFVLSGPMMVSIFVALLCGRLVRHVSKKHLLLVGYLIYVLAGVGAAFVTDIAELAIARGLVGICYGVFSAAAFGLIAELFPQESQRASMIGKVNATFALAAIAFAMLGGLVSSYNWRHAFLLNAVGLPILVMMATFLPHTAPERAAGGNPVADVDTRFSVWALIALCGSAFAFNLLFMILYYHLAVYVSEQRLGDSSVAGLVTAVLTLGSFAAGLAFSQAYKVVGRWIPVLFYFTAGVCFYALSFPLSITAVAMIALLCGTAYGMSYAYFCMRSTMIVPIAQVPMSAALVLSSVNVATYLCPFALSAYEGAFQVRTLASAFPYVGLTLLGCGVVSAGVAAAARIPGRLAPAHTASLSHSASNQEH